MSILGTYMVDRTKGVTKDGGGITVDDNVWYDIVFGEKFMEPPGVFTQIMFNEGVTDGNKVYSTYVKEIMETGCKVKADFTMPGTVSVLWFAVGV